MAALPRRMKRLIVPGRPSIYSIPPGANFLDELATALAVETGLSDNPEALADALIYVPNRRSERALAFALHKAGGRQASLLPDIRALGDLETDEPPPSAETALADLPPVMSPAKRIGGLTSLVMQYYQAQGIEMPAASCLSAARELARLLDQAALSGDVEWNNLADLVPEAELQRHWKQSLEFLTIITDHWPAQLEEATAMDPYARRFAAAEAMVADWQARPPETPVIIAGSTGATPASRLLMRAALSLPQGLVVLPGLDRDLDADALNAIALSPSHPQFSLSRTLTDLDLQPGDVTPWPVAHDSADQTARRRLIHEALAPAQSTADWSARLSEISENGDVPAFVSNALDGLQVITADHETDEALMAALLLRETLEHEGKTAALITPDAGLARHVSAMLKRWEIDVSPSAGQFLAQTDAGSLAALISDWVLDPSHPVSLMAVLNHPDCRIDQGLAKTLDRTALRGPRTWQDWPGLVAHLDQLEEEAGARHSRGSSAELADAKLSLDALSPIVARFDVTSDTPCTGRLWFETISAVISAICDHPRPWSGEDGAALSRLLRQVAEITEPLGEQLPAIWNELLIAEAAMVSVHDGKAHPRLAIWGPLEARLQTADLMILAGLNEGVWPAQPPADAFLPRIIRQKIGLSDPDERIGLSAHDFAQLAAAPNVTLLSSKRREDKPAVASRWLWRLRTLARGALGDDADAKLAPDATMNVRAWLTALEAAPGLPADFSAEPRPTPPLSARPKKLSVTRIEQLVRDPYAIYCEYVLRLRRLDPLNLPPDVRIRGTAVHKALERFETGDAAADADGLMSLLEFELRRGGEPEADLIALRDRRREVCEEYLVWRAAQQQQIDGDPHTEIYGETALQIGADTFTLSGTADRIEKRVGGGLAILDFKSGKPPSEKQVRAGLSPQMPLQGLIARNGGYEKLGPNSVEALTYLRFGTSFEVREIGDANRYAKLDALPIADIIADAEAGLVRLLTAFSDPAHPYLSAPRPERVSYESDYSRLARRDEWTSLATHD